MHVDATLGMGGHAEGVLDRFPGTTVVGIDRDREALALSVERLARFGDRFRPVHAVYDDIGDVVAGLGLTAVDGILFDLGVSSLQLDETDRGFAYRVDAPLDMRMDQSTGITAADVLNTYEAADLARVLRDYGEERFARKIAAAVVRERQVEPFTTSGRLVELLRRAIPMASQRQSGHPAKRTFQALRIEVNDELEVWRRAITGRDRRARRRRPDRGAVLPLPRGPHDEAGLRRRGDLEHPARAARRAARARGIPLARHPRRRGARRRRGGPQPPSHVGAPARRRAGPGDRPHQQPRSTSRKGSTR